MATKHKADTKPVQPKLAFGLAEAAAMLSISYPSIYRLVQRGKLRTIGALRKRLIPAAELQRFLEGAS